MIRCLLDPSIEEEDGQCYYCCCYCSKPDCEYRCPISNNTEDEICAKCIDAYEY